MQKYFEFESDFITSLRCIPMIVRFKLDTCGVKLKLTHWQQFNQEEKETLINKACETPQEINNYRNYVQQLAIAKTGSEASELTIEKNPAWLNEEIIPNEIKEKAEEVPIKLTINQWQKLTPLQRFALIKLSKPSHENKNFYPALKEFNLI